LYSADAGSTDAVSLVPSIMTFAVVQLENVTVAQQVNIFAAVT
jgi:hypothetical protein